MIPTTALLIALKSTPILSQTRDPQVKCLAGNWVPDVGEMKSSLGVQVDTPNVEFSGRLWMVVNATNLMDGVKFHANNWTLLCMYSDKPDSGFTVNGVAMLSLSTPQGGSFHLAETSKTPLLAILVAFGMSDDEQKIPAMIRLFLWLGTSLQVGSSVKFFAAGVMRNEILNGKVL